MPSNEFPLWLQTRDEAARQVPENLAVIRYTGPTSSLFGQVFATPFSMASMRRLPRVIAPILLIALVGCPWDLQSALVPLTSWGFFYTVSRAPEPCRYPSFCPLGIHLLKVACIRRCLASPRKETFSSIQPITGRLGSETHCRLAEAMFVACQEYSRNLFPKRNNVGGVFVSRP